MLSPRPIDGGAMKRTNRSWWIALALLATSACGGSPGDAGTPSGETSFAGSNGIPRYEAVAWPTMPNNWVLGLASGIAVDPTDHIWIFHRPRTVPEPENQPRAAPAVLEFDGDGNYIQGWGGPDYV